MSIFNKTSIKLSLGLVGMIAVVVLYMLFGDYLKKSWQTADKNNKLNDFYAQMDEREAKMIEAYQNDTYGGGTPEETWAMFIDALKNGDTDLAAKYFVVEKQEEMKAAFTAGKDNGAVYSFLNDVARIDSGDYLDNDKTQYRFVVIGNEGKWRGVVEFTYDLVLNKYTNKWKIESL